MPLGEILQRRDADVAAARARAEQAVRVLQQARADLQRAEDRAIEVQLIDRVKELETTMNAAIAEMRVVRNRLGGGPWGLAAFEAHPDATSCQSPSSRRGR